MAERTRLTINDLPNLVVRPPGFEDSFYLDNAATTPYLRPVKEAMIEAEELYGSVHRGNGKRARASTEAYEAARHEVAQFFGLTADYSLIFTNNTTAAINTLAGALFDESQSQRSVITTSLEHHSNDLPWRQVSGLEYAGIVPYDGSVNLEHLTALIRRPNRGRRVVAITGGSNVTGYMPDLETITEEAHRVGAIVAVDGAQLAPHRKINIAELGIDALAVSGHKMYAHGIGALAVRTDLLKDCEPPFPGGGTISLVTKNLIDWAPLPDRLEPGTPNLLGAVAFAAATRILSEIGMDAVAEHETELTKLALTQLQDIAGVTVFGDRDPTYAHSRLGVLPFLINDVPHAKTAAILGEEHNVDCRNGCFCAHMAVTELLHVTPEKMRLVRAEIANGDRRHVPGMVRFSWGAHTTEQELLAGIEGVRQIAQGNYKDDYVQDIATGAFYRPTR